MTRFGTRGPVESAVRSLASGHATRGKTERRRRGAPDLAGKKKESEREVEIDRSVYVVKSAAPKADTRLSRDRLNGASSPRTGAPPRARTAWRERTACAMASERLA